MNKRYSYTKGGGPNGECWEWYPATHRFGYGRLWIKGRAVYAHRYMWEKVNGPIPPGLCVLHLCDNPPCVNPEHLHLGTRSDNVVDRHMRQRDARGETHGLAVHPELRPRGERHGMAKINEDAVLDIRRRISNGEMQKSVAKDYGLSRNQIWRITKRLQWSRSP
jgi:hypothetical protein